MESGQQSRQKEPERSAQWEANTPFRFAVFDHAHPRFPRHVTLAMYRFRKLRLKRQHSCRSLRRAFTKALDHRDQALQIGVRFRGALTQAADGR